MSHIHAYDYQQQFANVSKPKKNAKTHALSAAK